MTEATAKDMAEAQIIDATDKEAPADYQPLFESETVSEKELMGEDTTEEKAATSEPEGEKKEPEVEKEAKGLEKDKEGEPKDEPKEPKEESKEPDPVKPPTGFVPVQAVQEERQKIKSLKAEIARLKAESVVTKDSKSEDKFKDFKVKTAEEYRELVNKDPDEAAIYMYELNEYRDHKAAEDSKKAADQHAEQSRKELISEGAQEIEKILPGFHKGENKDAPELAKYAVDEGFSESLLFDLTNPETTIIGQDGNRYVLGPGAANLIKMIQKMKKTSAISKDSIEKETESRLRPIIEAELQKTVLSKIKDPSGEYHSLDKVSASGKKETKSFTGTISEREFAQMSEADQRAYLGG